MPLHCGSNIFQITSNKSASRPIEDPSSKCNFFYSNFNHLATISGTSSLLFPIFFLFIQDSTSGLGRGGDKISRRVQGALREILGCQVATRRCLSEFLGLYFRKFGGLLQNREIAVGGQDFGSVTGRCGFGSH